MNSLRCVVLDLFLMICYVCSDDDSGQGSLCGSWFSPLPAIPSTLCSRDLPHGSSDVCVPCRLCPALRTLAWVVPRYMGSYPIVCRDGSDACGFIKDGVGFIVFSEIGKEQFDHLTAFKKQNRLLSCPVYAFYLYICLMLRSILSCD